MKNIVKKPEGAADLIRQKRRFRHIWLLPLCLVAALAAAFFFFRLFVHASSRVLFAFFSIVPFFPQKRKPL